MNPSDPNQALRHRYTRNDFVLSTELIHTVGYVQGVVGIIGVGVTGPA
jgi:hypothetical protein